MGSIDDYIDFLQDAYYHGLLCAKDVQHRQTDGSDIEPVILLARCGKDTEMYTWQEEIIRKIREFVGSNYHTLEQIAAEIWGKEKNQLPQSGFVPEYIGPLEKHLEKDAGPVVADVGASPLFKSLNTPESAKKSLIVGLIGIEFYNRRLERNQAGKETGS